MPLRAIMKPHRSSSLPRHWRPAVGGFPSSTSIPTTLGAASQQLRSRGIYIDYMSDDLRTAIDCLRVAGYREGLGL